MIENNDTTHSHDTPIIEYASLRPGQNRRRLYLFVSSGYLLAGIYFFVGDIVLLIDRLQSSFPFHMSDFILPFIIAVWMFYWAFHYRRLLESDEALMIRHTEHIDHPSQRA